VGAIQIDRIAPTADGLPDSLADLRSRQATAVDEPGKSIAGAVDSR
jgi:hypothetical protein